MLIFKNIFSFVLTFYTYDWLVEAYVKKPFMAISSIQVAICALSIPMCMCSPRPSTHGTQINFAG
jgi:hypothetical protein